MNCEQCGKNTDICGNLTAVNFWQFSEVTNARKTISYLYVCSICFKTRKDWCKNLFPEICEACFSPLPSGEYYLETELNANGQSIEIHGLSLSEECRIVCNNCFNKLNQK